MKDTRRTRVVHVLPHFRSGGGAERVAAHLMCALDRDRFDVRAIGLAAQSGSDIEDILDRGRIPVRYLGKGPGFEPRMFGRVRRALAECAPEILHTHVHVLRYTLPATLLRPAPLMIHTVHNVAQEEVEPRAQWLQKLALKRCGIVPVAVSQRVADSLAERYGIANSLVVPNGVPVEKYSHPRVSREHWRRAAGFTQDEVLFVCVARFEPQKNHRMLLRAFAEGLGEHPKARLLLVGDGHLRGEIERAAAADGAGNRVSFLGFRTDVPEVLGAADVFVLSSDYEGNPLVVLEAMAAGLPVAATSAGGVPELVDTGVHGHVVAPGDSGALGAAMRALADSPARRLQMGSAARRRAMAEFDVAVMTRAYAAIYAELGARAGLTSAVSTLAARP